MRLRLLVIIGLLVMQLFTISVTQAASSLQIIDNRVSYTFAGQIEFQAEVRSTSPIEEVLVFIRTVDDPNTFVGSAVIKQGTASYTYDLTKYPLRAFSEIEYWYVVKTRDQNLQNSEVFTFFYEDNRFDWQVLEDDPFRVHWYEGDIDFAQSILDSAHAGLDKSLSLLNLLTPDQIDIYVYASGLEMQSTLRLADLDWIAGHADPEMNVMMVSLPPGPDQNLEIERQIPHELTHILMYQTIPTGYDHLPLWLKEGLASINELKPNPDYYIILNSAIARKNLFPIVELCDNFPTDAAGIYLAYAQADSFTRFIHQQYGVPGLQGLLDNYSTGMDCERGVEISLGMSLEQLDSSWTANLSGRTTAESAVDSLLPWAFLLLIVLGMPALLAIGFFIRKKNPTPAGNIT